MPPRPGLRPRGDDDVLQMLGKLGGDGDAAGRGVVTHTQRSVPGVDEDALKTVASTTGGEYFAATDADQLQNVLNDLPRHVTTQQQDVDISANNKLQPSDAQSRLADKGQALETWLKGKGNGGEAVAAA